MIDVRGSELLYSNWYLEGFLKTPLENKLMVQEKALKINGCQMDIIHHLSTLVQRKNILTSSSPWGFVAINIDLI